MKKYFKMEVVVTSNRHCQKMQRKTDRDINNNNSNQFINILVRIYDMTSKQISLIFSSWEYNKCLILLFCSVQFVCSVMSNSLLSHGLQHTRLPYPYQLPELAETNGHRISDAIQPSHPLSSPSLPAFSLAQHQSVF